MARQRPDEIVDELNKQETENYGEDTASGSGTPEPIDIDDVAKETFGNDIDQDEELNVAEQIESDEEELAGIDSAKS